MTSAKDDSRLFIHGFDACKRFNTNPLLTQPAAAGLKRLLNCDSRAYEDSARLSDQTDQTLQRRAVGKKVVNNQHAVVRTEKGVNI